MRTYPHLEARVFETPLAIARPKLDAILHALGPRLGLDVSADARPSTPRASGALEVDNGVARIAIVGTLVRRAAGVNALSGLRSYGEIGAELDAAIADPRVEGIVLEVDSAGGEVGGLFALAEKIQAARTKKRVFAVAADDALSAAYAIASAAERVYVSPFTGSVGSVGIVALHVDESGSDAKAGLRFEYVFAGAKKIDGNPHEPLSEGARKDLQAEVDRLHGIFVESVARNRSMPVEAVRETNAAIFSAGIALAAGLADHVGGLDDATKDLRAELARRRT